METPTTFDAAEPLLVSCVVPVYRGETTLGELARRIVEVAGAWEATSGFPFELVEAILVDDGSVDGSAAVLRRLEDEHEIVRVLTLSRNFGQHPATCAGILHSAGDWILTLDEDLQHRPESFESLLREAVVESRDVVYAQPRQGVHASWYRDLASRTYKRLLGFAIGARHFRRVSSFRAVRGNVARAAASVARHDTFFDVALGWFTDRFSGVEADLRDPRDESAMPAPGYSLARLLSHARRAVVSSQTKWLRLGAAVGIGALVFSLALVVWIVTQKALDPSSIAVRGWASTFVAVVFFGGLSSFLVGVVLEYLSTLLLQAHGKPTFFMVYRRSDEAARAYFLSTADTDDADDGC